MRTRKLPHDTVKSVSCRTRTPPDGLKARSFYFPMAGIKGARGSTAEENLNPEAAEECGCAQSTWEELKRTNCTAHTDATPHWQHSLEAGNADPVQLSQCSLTLVHLLSAEALSKQNPPGSANCKNLGDLHIQEAGVLQ